MRGKKLNKSHVVKLIVFAVIFALLGSVYVYRVKKVNEILPKTETISYKVGDTIDFGEDIMINYPMTGYSIRVNDSNVLTYEAFIKKYNAKDEYTFVPDKIYEVNVTLNNEDAEDDIGISLYEFYLQKNGALSSVDTNMLSIANPKLDGVADIALVKNSSFDITLTFGLYDYQFDKHTWENLEDYGLNLVVTLYPTKKVVSLM